MVVSGEDFTARLMNDMPPELLDLVKTRVNSFIKWDLVRFFRENPHTADTADNIAKYIGRNRAAIEPELHDLVSSGVMEMQTTESISVYSLAEDAQMRSLIDQFIAACEDRHFRVKVIYHIVRGMH